MFRKSVIHNKNTGSVQPPAFQQGMENTAFIQPKLNIGKSRDKYEVEADGVADTIVSKGSNQTQTFFSLTPAKQKGKVQKKEGKDEEIRKKPLAERITPLIQKQPEEEIQAKCTECGKEDSVQKKEGSYVQTKCTECEKKEAVQKQEEQEIQAKSDTSISSVPMESRLNSSKGQGNKISDSTRNEMESGFGADFSRVNIHTDSTAIGMNRELGAQAFTHGTDIYFNQGKYNPDSKGGKHLLAHELTHTIQQNGIVEKKVQKRGDPDEVPSGMLCKVATDNPSSSSEVASFPLASASLTPAQEAGINNLANNWNASGGSDTIRIDGYASVDGPDSFNWDLSCRRALRVRDLLHTPPDGSPGIPLSFIDVFAQGETSEFGNLEANRRVSINIDSPTPITPVKPKAPNCGPDITSWYVSQVARAMADPDVLLIRRLMSRADRIARRNGTTVAQVTEGGSAAAVVAQETRMALTGSAPTRTRDANRQIAAGTRSGRAAARALVFSPRDAFAISKLVAKAALKWRSLVNHGARYDFKAHVMKRPKTTNCPDKKCQNSITICPGVLPANCYLTDVPGNLFYAQIGRFTGFSTLTLQLGSQLAQLTGTGSFDPPQDTASIRVGARLSTPSSTSDLCSVVPPERGNLNNVPKCQDCIEPTTAPFK